MSLVSLMAVAMSLVSLMAVAMLLVAVAMSLVAVAMLLVAVAMSLVAVAIVNDGGLALTANDGGLASQGGGQASRPSLEGDGPVPGPQVTSDPRGSSSFPAGRTSGSFLA